MLAHENLSMREGKPGTVPRPSQAPCMYCQRLRAPGSEKSHFTEPLGEMLHPEMFQGDGSRTSFNLKPTGRILNEDEKTRRVCAYQQEQRRKTLSSVFAYGSLFSKACLPLQHFSCCRHSNHSIARATYWPNTAPLSIARGLVAPAGRRSTWLNSLSSEPAQTWSGKPKVICHLSKSMKCLLPSHKVLTENTSL